ncbi:hypothetical protein DPMN_161400 [Dreissena polymorpha]|uniref:Uncharacterized protein n=1 Tax=Dreissena polymorpha TaxID=45954 RepID=A0A9D4ENE1_DREPO|nr:hypothetical protein DPMN_161400 [Dreissena polymorpha]
MNQRPLKLLRKQFGNVPPSLPYRGGKALVAPPERFQGSSVATKTGETNNRHVWVELTDFRCSSKCPSKKPGNWHCLKDDEPVLISQLGVIKCKSGEHQGDVHQWGWNCGSEYHKGKLFFQSDMEEFTWALSQAVQLIGRMGSTSTRKRPPSQSFRGERPPAAPPERFQGSQYSEPYPLTGYAASSVARGTRGKDEYGGQLQEQRQLQRSKEASKQMLYSVYGNFLAILEEYEARQSAHRHFRRSKIAISDQSRNTDEETCCCSRPNSGPVKEQLKWKATLWSAVRAEQGCSMRQKDIFISQLYEILETNRTTHAQTSRPKPTISEATIRPNLPHIMAGKHEQVTLDSVFKADTSRAADCPRVRKPVDYEAFR